MSNETPPQKTRKRWVKYLRLCVASLLLIFLLTPIGLNELLLVIRNIRLLPFMGIMVCVFALITIGAFNIWLLLNTLTPVAYRNLLKVYFYSWAISLITPGQSGDATIILLMKEQKIPFSLTGAAYFIDKTITLFIFTIISVYGCSYLLPDYKINYLHIFPVIALVSLVSAAVLFLLFTKLKIIDRLHKFIGNLQRNMVIIKNNYHIVLANTLMTLIKWIVVSWSFRLAFLSFGVNIKWPDIGVIPIMSTLIGYIPISIAGLGTVELTASYLFKIKGIDTSTVIVAYILLRLINYFCAFGVVTFMDPFKNRCHE